MAPTDTAVDRAFATAGQASGIEIWRIEKLTPVPVPKTQYGKFYSGDSYIVLQTIGGKSSARGFSYNIYFWLGRTSSVDEQAACAYKTVELDQKFNGVAVQYREVQEYESPQFVALFNHKLEYLDGGVASGLKSVEARIDADNKPRLFQIKGKRHIRVLQIPPRADSLNSGDVFILDDPKSNLIYQWNGKGASLVEKAECVRLISDLRSENCRRGLPEIITIDEATDDGKASDKFWEVLKGNKSMVRPEVKTETDAQAAKDALEAATLYRISDASGKMKATVEAKGNLKHALLDSADSFVVDCGSEIFVWNGKGTTLAEKQSSLKFGTDFLKQEKRPDWTKLTRVMEGHETTWFKSKFTDWM